MSAKRKEVLCKHCGLVHRLPTIEDIVLNSTCYTCRRKGETSKKYLNVCASCGYVISYCPTCKEVMGANEVETK